MVEINLLGRFEILLNGEAVDIGSRPTQNLLAYLALFSRENHRREKVAGVLWPESDELNARKYLSQALWRLRKLLGESFFAAEKYTIRLNPTADIRVDVAAFEAAGDHSIMGLTASLSAYTGRLLPDFYEEWVIREANRLNVAFERQSQILLNLLEQSKRWKEAVEWAERRIRIGSVSESAYRTLMRSHIALGDQARAVAAYNRCAQALRDELDVDVSSETKSLLEQIRLNEYYNEVDEPVSRRPRQITEPPPNPYRGLFAFREEDAHLFFGREQFSESVLNDIKRKPFLALVGPSGSGKSSVVYAGVLAALTDVWLPIILRPGERPMFALSSALMPYFAPELRETERLIETRKLADSLMNGDVSLNDVLDTILKSNQPKQRLLIVIDQFEELFSMQPDVDLQTQFLDVLLSVVNGRSGRSSTGVTILIVMRADFFGHALAFHNLSDELQKSDKKLGPMSRENLSRAITRPAGIESICFEPGLVERILDDVAHEPGHLPLLEFALSLLWDQLETTEISHSAYEAIGRVEGALSSYADEVYEKLTSEEQKICRQVFVQLVLPGEGTEDARRLASRADIGEEHWPLIVRLADERLVVTGRDAAGSENVEVVHEALIRRWGRLRRWMAEAREFRRWQERLRSALWQWQVNNHSDGALLRSLPLSEAESWLEQNSLALSQSEKKFIHASQEFRDQKQAEEERRANEHEKLRSARERMRRTINIGLWISLLVTIILSGFTYRQWDLARSAQLHAEEERDRADAQAQVVRELWSSQLAANVSSIYEDQLDLGILLSLEALNIADTFQARSSLLSTLTNNPLYFSRLWGESEVSKLAFNPDGSILAAGYSDGAIILWNVNTGKQISAYSGFERGVDALTFNLDGTVLAAAGDDASIILWEINNGEDTGVYLAGHTDDVLSLAFSPGGEILASGGLDRSIILWDVSMQRQSQIIPTNHWVQALAFSNDGMALASGGCSTTQNVGMCTEGEIRLWDPLSGNALGQPVAAHSNSVTLLAFSPDGTALLSAGKFDEMVLSHPLPSDLGQFGMATIETIQTRQGTGSMAVSFDTARKEWLAWAEDDSFVIAMPARQTLSGHSDQVTSVAVNFNGKVAASGSKDHSIILWNLNGDQGLGKSAPAHFSDFLGRNFLDFGFADPWSVLVNRDNEFIVFGNNDHSGKVVKLSGVSNRLEWFIMSPDRQFLAALDVAGRLIAWNTVTGQQIGPALDGQMIRRRVICSDGLLGIPTITISPDSRLLASVSQTGEITILDLQSGELVGEPLVGHEGSHSWSLRFSIDGAQLVSGGGNGDLIIWDVGTGEILTRHEALHPGGIPIVDYTPDGERIVTGSKQALIMLEGNPSSESFGSRIGDPIERCLGWVDKGFHTYGVFQKDFSLQFWNLDTMQPISEPTEASVIKRWSDSVRGGENGEIMATIDENHNIMLWDLAGGKPLFPPLTGHENEIVIKQFSPDAKYFVTLDVDKYLKLWDVTTGMSLDDPFPVRKDSVRNVGFNQDSSILAADIGGVLHLWDLKLQRLIGRLNTGHRETIIKFAFSEDGNSLTTMSSDAIYYWDLRVASWREDACFRANRNLTQKEWNQYFGDQPYRETCPGVSSEK